MILKLVLAGLIPVTIVSAAGLVLQRLLLKSSALVRRQVVISALILAAAFAFMPLAPKPVLRSLPSPHLPQAIRTVEEVSRAPEAMAYQSFPPVATSSGAMISPADVVQWLLLGITSLLLGRWAFGWLAAFILRQRSTHYATDFTSVPVKLTRVLEVPASLGGFHGVILLPEDCLHLDPLDLERILLHEEAHIRNGDHWWNALAELLCALHWFNPLVWVLRRTLRMESEHLADDVVVLSGHSAPAYADLLLRYQSHAPKLRLSPLQPIATRNAMASRFRSILRPSTRRSLMKPQKSLLLAGITGLISLPIAVGFLAPSALLASTSNSGQLKSNDDSRRVELVQVGRKIGTVSEFWDSSGNLVSPKEPISYRWRPEEVSKTGVVQRYLHVVFRVEAKDGDTQPETSVGSPNNRTPIPVGIAMGYASSDFLYTKGGWHYFVDHLSLGPLDSSAFPGAATPPGLKGVKDLGHRVFEPANIGIWFASSQWTDEGSIAKSPWVKSISIQTADKLPMGFGMEKISKVWTKLTFVTENEPVEDAREYDAYRTDGTKLPENLVQGSFGQYESKNPHMLDSVYYIGVPMSQFDHLSKRSRPSFKGDLEVPLSPNSDKRNGSSLRMTP